MASAHGAGLMLVPVLTRLPALHLRLPGEASASAAPSSSMPANCPMLTMHLSPAHAAPIDLLTALGAVGVHTVSMLIVATVIALAVYEKMGLSLLRQAWFNLDKLWAAALIAAGVIALAL